MPIQLQDQPNYQADVTVHDKTNIDDGNQYACIGRRTVIVQLMHMGALVNNSDRTFVTANLQDQ